MEKISVILGTYNQLDNLKRAVAGWEKQTYKDFKLYVCDDGSTDGTKEWAKKQSFQYFWQENKGMRLAKSLNNAIKVAKGKYCLFVMGDSVPIPEYLEKMAPYLNDNSVLCGVREDVTENMEHIKWDWRYRGREWQLKWDFSVIRDLEWAKITGNGLLIPMKLLKKVGMWPENYEGYGSEDNYLAVKLLAEDALFLDVPQAILKHIEHPIKLESLENIRRFQKGAGKIFKELKEKIKPQQITFTLDDFSPVNANLFFLEKLRDNYPNLKVTLFIIPETVQMGKAVSLLDRPEFCKQLSTYMDWIELCPHGWNHPDLSKGNKPEFIDMSYYETARYTQAIEEMFEEINLPYKKIFRPPQFKISEASKDALRDCGWTLSVSGTGEYWPRDIQLVTDNWNIRNNLPLRKKIITYGHVQDIGNGLHQCWGKLLQMHSSTEFKFLSEVVDEKIGIPKHL